MPDFSLDPRLQADSRLIMRLGLCQMRLMEDARWPWVILVPQRNSITEIFELTPLDQTMLTFEMGLAAKAIKEASGCAKVNIGALGNVVSQLHFHIIGRNEGDPAWPGPVWGRDGPEPWDEKVRETFVERLMGAL